MIVMGTTGMNEVTEVKEAQQHYRALYKNLRIGNKEYAILDSKLALQRAQMHLQLAKQLMLEANIEQQHLVINRELLLATDFGCNQAPYLLACRLLQEHIPSDFPMEEVVVFLKIAAERNNAEAAFRMACSYAGMKIFQEIESVAVDYFNGFAAAERSHLAELYFHKAIELQHQAAIEELTIAYAYGRGHISKNADKFVQLCEQQIQLQNQTVNLGYAAWLLGMTVEGKQLLPGAVQIDLDPNKALECLLTAIQGQDLELAEHALGLLCIGMNNAAWSDNYAWFRKKIIQSAINGNQLLALYLAWYSIPSKERETIPHEVFERYQREELSELVRINEQDALAYLDCALLGQDEDISAAAKAILSHVYGQHLDANGRLHFADS